MFTQDSIGYNIYLEVKSMISITGFDRRNSNFRPVSVNTSDLKTDSKL